MLIGGVKIHNLVCMLELRLLIDFEKAVDLQFLLLNENARAPPPSVGTRLGELRVIRFAGARELGVVLLGERRRFVGLSRVVFGKVEFLTLLVEHCNHAATRIASARNLQANLFARS